MRCISGPQLQVSDRAMQFFENDYFLGILRAFKQITFSMIVPVIVEFADTYWHKISLESFNSLKVILKEIGPAAFDKALQTIKEASKENSLNSMHNLARRKNIEAQWDSLTKNAKGIDPDFNAPLLPYVEYHVVGLNNMNGIQLTSNNLVLVVRINSNYIIIVFKLNIFFYVF